MIRRLCLFAALSLLLSTSVPTLAQQDDPLQGRILQNSDGTLFVYKDGQRYLIQTADLTDDQINALPIAGAVARVDQLFAPTATPPSPTPTPSPPSVLAIGDSWIEGDLKLTASAPRPAYLGQLASDFSVENHTGSPINFEVPASAFYLQLSTGKRYTGNYFGDPLYVGQNPNFDFPKFTANDFQDNGTIGFTLIWSAGTGDFEADKRNPSVTFYEVGVAEFSSHIHNAKWRDTVQH